MARSARPSNTSILPTNQGVGSSNLSGRAKSLSDLAQFATSRFAALRTMLLGKRTDDPRVGVFDSFAGHH